MPNTKTKGNKVCWCGNQAVKWKLCGWVCERCDKIERLQHASEAHARYQELIKSKLEKTKIDLFGYRLSGL